MTAKQKILLEQSKTRERINELLGLAEKTDEQRAEMSTLTDRAQEIEVELRAAIVAEPQVTTETTETGLDAEARERLELRSKSAVVSYVKAACEMRSVNGPEAEYNAALGMGVDQFPLELLAPPEVRQNTDTDTSTNQQTWLDRLFDMSAARYLGVTFNSVGPGVASFPITTAGASGKRNRRNRKRPRRRLGPSELPNSNRNEIPFIASSVLRMRQGSDPAWKMRYSVISGWRLLKVSTGPFSRAILGQVEQARILSECRRLGSQNPL